jgi:hypothetical protein
MKMPEEFSEEWNVSCALRPISIRPLEISSAILGFNYFLIVFECLFVGTSLIAFPMISKKYIYMKKRSYLAIFLMGINTVWAIILGPLRDIVGAQNFSCDLQIWLRATSGTSGCIWYLKFRALTQKKTNMYI